VYVGSGQIGDWAAAESATYAFALAEAERLGKRRVAKKLRAIGPPPHSAESLWTQRTSLSRLEGRMRPRALWTLARAALGGPESSILDLPGGLRGFRFSLDAMWAEVSRLNLIELAPALEMPVFYFLGRNDHWVPAEVRWLRPMQPRGLPLPQCPSHLLRVVVAEYQGERYLGCLARA
jgi:pimeloyl-ACP methyl ester carboxylesterase